jgi:xylulokinase
MLTARTIGTADRRGGTGMRSGCLVGLDIGSSSVRALALAVGTGRVLAVTQEATPVSRSLTAVELAPAALRLAVESALRRLMASLPGGYRPLGVAATSVGEAGAPVDEAGTVLRNVIWWQDSRSAGQVTRLAEAVGAERLERIAGHPVDPTWGIGRVMWVRENQPEIYDRTAAWLPVADLATLWLTGETVTSASLASRTMAWDQHGQCWSGEILTAAEVDVARMPPVVPSGTSVGAVTQAAASRTGLPAGLPVSVAGHDRQCGAFAARQGTAAPVDSAGTAEALLISVTAADDMRRLGTGIGWYADVEPGRHTYAARIGLAGGLLDWAKQVFFDSADVNYRQILAEIPTPYTFTGVVCTPTFGRYSSPYWAASAVPGVISGLTTSHVRADILQALLEAPAFALRATLEVLDSWFDEPLETVRVEGGIVQNQPWLQSRADIIGRPLLSIEQQHMTAIGAALLAGLGSGTFSSAREAGSSLPLTLREWSPDPDRGERYAAAFDRYVQPLASFLAGVPDDISQRRLAILAQAREGRSA